MRFAKLALPTFAVLAVAALGAAAIAQQPTTTPPAEQPATAPAEQPATDAAPEAPVATPAPVVAPPPVPAESHAAGDDHGEDAAHASGSHDLLAPKGGWTHDGHFGTFDTNALQRGFKVYKEVCAACHGMKLLSFRNLGEVGGPFYNPAYPNPNDNPVVKQIASEFLVSQIDPESGDMVDMPGKTSDRFPSPFANAVAASVANGGAVPPDLSVISKARNGGAAYLYSLLMGYDAPPAGLVVNPGQHYNAYFHGDTASQWVGKDPRKKPPGGFLAMASPLEFAEVAFDDGTATTLEQMAHDVSLFLTWASDPKAEARRQLGTAVIPFLFLLAILTFLSYRRIWRNVEH